MCSSFLTVNPYDFRVRDWGLYVEGRLPVVLGNDIAGTVEELGPNTSTPLKPDDHIFGQTNYLKNTSDQCGLQEYCLLDAYTCGKIPENLTDDDGASLVCNIVAPFWAIFGVDGLDLPFPFPSEDAVAQNQVDHSEETILIIGAGSNCGKYGVQVCGLAGFGTIIAVADRGKHESDLRSYGATHVIDRHADDVEAQVRDVVGDDLIYAFDAVNSDHTLGASCLSNTRRGTLACIVPGTVADEGEMAAKKRAGFEDRFVQGQSHNQPELARKFWHRLPAWMAEGKIRSTGWTVLEGLDPDKVNAILDSYRDNRWPEKQVHVHL